MDEGRNLASLLPDDKQLCDRSKKWCSVFKKYEKAENENLAVPLDVLCSLGDINILEGEIEVDEESVDPSEFEDNDTKDDPDFNIKNVLNQTKPIIEKRKESWSRSGIDRLMDTFCCDKVNVKVDDWLKHNCDYFSSKFSRESGKHCFNEIKINEHNIVMERSFDDNSTDSSVDTAKYILSNRKRRKSKVTMTIKQFCYSTQKANDETGVKSKSPEKFSLNKMIKMCNGAERSSGKKNQENLKKAKSFKRKQHVRTLCTSSSLQSSSTSSEENVVLKKRSNSAVKKYLRNQKPTKKYFTETYSNNENSEDSERVLPKYKYDSKSKRKSKDKSKPPAESFKDSGFEQSEISARVKAPAENNASMKQRLKTGKQAEATDKQALNSSDLNTTSREVFNSTAIKSQDSMIQCKRNFQTVCQNLKNSNDNNVRIDQNNTDTTIKGLQIRNGSTPIIIYSPKELLAPNSALQARKVKITEKHLEKSLGSELKNKFLGNQKKFHYECSPNAKLLFIPPDEEEHVSTDSETDPLDKLGRSEKGKIIEVVNLNCVNRN